MLKRITLQNVSLKAIFQQGCYERLNWNQVGSVAVLGNGSVLAVIARFKSLRTVPNLLIANLSVVDLLNAAICMPIYTISSVWEWTGFRGKTLAVMFCFFYRLFIILNLESMLALMANMYLAIAFDLKNLTWKTNKKAVICVLFIWIVGGLELDSAVHDRPW